MLVEKYAGLKSLKMMLVATHHRLVSAAFQRWRSLQWALLELAAIGRAHFNMAAKVRSLLLRLAGERWRMVITLALRLWINFAAGGSLVVSY